MAKLSLLVLLLLSFYSTGRSQKVLCFYKNWTTYRPSPCTFTQNHEDLSVKYCTHLVYYYADLDETGDIISSDPYSDLPADEGKAGYQKINALKDGSDHFSTIISLGAPNSAEAFSKVAASESTRAEFSSKVVQFLIYNGFDGVLVDWMYPSAEDKANLAKLLETLSNTLEAEDLVLGIAVPNAEQRVTEGFDVSALNFADFVVVDGFFYRELSYGVYHPSPLYKCEGDSFPTADNDTVAYAVEMYEHFGLEPEKIIVGAYGDGKSFTVEDPKSVEIGSPTKSWGQQQQCTASAGTINYDESCDDSWKRTFIDSCKATLAVKGNLVAAVESVESVTAKAEFAKKYGGIMLRNSMEGDDFDGSCGTEQELLSIMYKTLVETN